MISDARVKINYEKVKKICEYINELMDNNYLILDENRYTVNSKYRFKFKEPNWKKIENHIWFDEITFSTYGYFDPDQTWLEAKKFWNKWKAIPKDHMIKVIKEYK